MFEDYPVASRRTFSWHDKKITHYLDTKEFLKETKVEVVESFGAIPFAELLGQPPLLMWEHQGRCPCGKRSYLFGQCSKCLKEDLEIKATEESVAVQPEVCNDEATFDLDGAEAKTGGSLRSSPLPSILPTPDIRTGTEMRHVEFITESAVKLISRDGPDGTHAKGRKGVVYVQHWAPHSEFELKAKAKALVASSDYPYRIAFVVELSGDVVPLQQCTDVRFEDEHLGHKAKKPQWIRDPACLIGMWEPSPVSKQLDVWIHRRKGDEIDERVRVEGAIRKFVLLVCAPMPMCRLVIRQSGKKGDWAQELWDYIIGFESGSADNTRAVVFGRSSVLERWIVVYASEFPTTRRSFQAVLHSVVHASDADAWCIVVGKVPAGGRKVVTLFSDKWMVYDRYGQFRYNQPKLLPCEPGLVPAAGAEVIEGPVPNTVYAPKGDPRLIDGDELTLLPEVVDYYKELHDKRQANAHRAQSEHGDGEFELGSSLRVTWIPAQRADKALMPMFAKGAMKEGFRIAKDGLLERLVQLPPPANARGCR